jgi:hypothetical protein
LTVGLLQLLKKVLVAPLKFITIKLFDTVSEAIKELKVAAVGVEFDTVLKIL